MRLALWVWAIPSTHSDEYKMPGYCPFLYSQITKDRSKNNYRNTIYLTRLLRAGELTPVRIPDLTHEAMRDLIRARAAAKRDCRVLSDSLIGSCKL